MPELPFTKAHGAGNDFLIVDRNDLSGLGVPDSGLPGLARKICDRRFGVGADGLEIVGPSELPDVVASAHLWNSDGSAAEISGNGTRCVAAYVSQRTDLPERFVIETGAGPREVVRTAAAHPDFAFRMTSRADACRVLDGSLSLHVDGERFEVTSVDVGNPQCVRRVRSFDFDWRELGRRLERHPHFAAGSNVSFVRVRARRDASPVLEVRFWERGAGATLSSGTGALGAALAARHHGWIGASVEIETEGGTLVVDWEDGIGLTGPAKIVAQGLYQS